MDIVVKRISGKEEEMLLFKVVKFLKSYYESEIGDAMDFKFSLLSNSSVEKFLVQYVSDDPQDFFCLLLFDSRSFGFWLVDECFENKKLEISISNLFRNLQSIENDISYFENLIRKAQ